MHEKSRTYRQLLIVTTLGVAFNILSVICPVSIPQADRLPNRFHISGQTATPATAQIFFDRGYGFSESQSSNLPYSSPANGFAELYFPLPAGRIVGLRFDPSS